MTTRRAAAHLSRRVRAAYTAQPFIGGGGGAASTPLTIFLTTPPVLWVRGDLGVTNVAGSCTALADQSAAAHNMLLLTGAPTITVGDVTLNALQTLHFGAALGLWTGALSLTLNPPFSIIIVAKPTTWNSATALVGDAANANRGQIAFAGTTPQIFQDNGAFKNATAAPLNSWYRMLGKFTNSVSDSLKIGSAAPVTGNNAGAGVPANMALNTNGAGVGAGVFDFWELVVLPGIATAGEYTAYDAYLTAKTAGAVAV